jgi:hypothetical protein
MLGVAKAALGICGASRRGANVLRIVSLLACYSKCLCDLHAALQSR